jgi:hypothetical protein
LFFCFMHARQQKDHGQGKKGNSFETHHIHVWVPDQQKYIIQIV